MNTNSKRLGIYLVIMLLATAVATTLRSIACVMHLDYVSGFFSDKLLVGASDVIITITTLSMFSYLLVASRINLRASFSTGATYVPTGILGVATAFLGVKVFSHVLVANNYKLFEFNFINTTPRGIIAGVITSQNLLSMIGLITGALAFVSIAHHFFNAFVTESKDVTRAYFAIVSIAFLALYAVMVYTDTTVAINESAKTLRQLSFLLSAAFFLYEARISLGREMWRVYTAFGLVAASLTAYTSIPAIITYFAKNEVISSYNYKSLASIEEYILLLALFIFIVSRLCLTAMLSEEKKNELVEAFKGAAAEREAEVSESAERHAEIFASKQLSIFDLYGEEQELEVVEEAEEPIEATEPEEEEKELTISDDAIYESIFGVMPERDEPKDEEAEEEPVDDRDPEKIANDLFNAFDEAMKDNSDI